MHFWNDPWGILRNSFVAALLRYLVLKKCVLWAAALISTEIRFQTTKMIVAGGRIAEKVMLQLCQRVLDGKGIPDKWKTSVVVPIFKEKGDAMNYGSHRGVKLLKHGMKIIH